MPVSDVMYLPIISLCCRDYKNVPVPDKVRTRTDYGPGVEVCADRPVKMELRPETRRTAAICGK